MPTRDVRKMKPMELVKFSLRVLRRTPASRMRTSAWFTPTRQLAQLLRKANIRYASQGVSEDADKFFRLIFRHRKDCFACAVGCILLADGREAAQSWDGGVKRVYGGSPVRSFSIFATQFFLGMSHQFETESHVTLRPQDDLSPTRISVAKGRQATIDYAEAELEKLKGGDPRCKM